MRALLAVERLPRGRLRCSEALCLAPAVALVEGRFLCHLHGAEHLGRLIHEARVGALVDRFAGAGWDEIPSAWAAEEAP
jgi:hypothetical protein